MSVCVFAGTFDPFTNGHEYVVEKCLEMFDKVIIAVGVNVDKKPLFTTEERVDIINAVYQENDKIEVAVFEGMLVDFMKKKGAIYNVRGVRNACDFEYENKMHHYNLAHFSDLITIYLPCSESLIEVSSTSARKGILNGEFDENILSKSVIEIIKKVNLKDSK